jgi:hypothetical protein
LFFFIFGAIKIIHLSIFIIPRNIETIFRQRQLSNMTDLF